MVLGLLTLAAIPTTIGVAEGVSEQRRQNKEDAEESRMAKFYLDVYCEAKSRKTKDLHGRRVVLRDDKVWIDEPIPGLRDKPSYTAQCFYITYPDEERADKPRGLVTKISDDPPMLNWIYVDKNTLELKYGNRTQSREHHVGPWDWTEEDETGVTMEGWEGFVAVEEEKGEWAVYFDRKDNKLRGAVGKDKRVLQISLERRLIEEKDKG